MYIHIYIYIYIYIYIVLLISCLLSTRSTSQLGGRRISYIIDNGEGASFRRKLEAKTHPSRRG